MLARPTKVIKPKASSDSYTFLRRVVVKTGLSLLKYLKI